MRSILPCSVLGIGNLDAAQGMVEDAAADDANVLGTIHDETGFHDGPGSEIDSAIAGYLDLFAGQVLGFVYAGTEVNETSILHEDILGVFALPVDDRPL